MYRLARRHHQPQVGLEQVVLGPAAVLGDPLQVHPHVAGQVFADPGELLLGEQARLDPLGEVDLLLGVEQRDLADLLQVVLDRVRRRAGDRHLRGGKILVIVAEDEDLLVLAARLRESLTARAPAAPGPRSRRPPRRTAGPSQGPRGLQVRPVLPARRRRRPDRRPPRRLGDIADVVGEDSQDGERGLEAGIVGVEIAEVARIRVLQIRVGIQISLAGFHRDQAAAGVGGQPRTVFIRVPVTRTVWPRSHLNRRTSTARGPWPEVMERRRRSRSARRRALPCLVLRLLILIAS